MRFEIPFKIAKGVLVLSYDLLQNRYIHNSSLFNIVSVDFDPSVAFHAFNPSVYLVTF